MNKNLPKKLAAKAAVVKSLMDPRYNAYGNGARAFKEVGGSYGRTINPYNEVGGRQEHKEFRQGFVDAHNAARPKKPVIQEA